ncbi:gp53-like domain-containing protein, partial [Enterobacter roggenkampii]|nr:hypothetical protein [Enterobacter roggenkampii]
MTIHRFSETSRLTFLLFPENVGLGDVAKAGVAGGLLASDGYITLPLIIGGVKTNVILQWVTGPTAGAETVNYPNVTFPVTFPNACL